MSYREGLRAVVAAVWAPGLIINIPSHMEENVLRRTSPNWPRLLGARISPGLIRLPTRLESEDQLSLP